MESIAQKFCERAYLYGGDLKKVGVATYSIENGDTECYISFSKREDLSENEVVEVLLGKKKTISEPFFIFKFKPKNWKIKQIDEDICELQTSYADIVLDGKFYCFNKPKNNIYAVKIVDNNIEMIWGKNFLKKAIFDKKVEVNPYRAIKNYL